MVSRFGLVGAEGLGRIRAIIRIRIPLAIMPLSFPSWKTASTPPEKWPSSDGGAAQRSARHNALRAHLAEFGVIAPRGLRHVERLVAAIEDNHVGVPELARSILRLVVAQWHNTQAKVRQIEAKLARWNRNHRVPQRTSCAGWPTDKLQSVLHLIFCTEKPRNFQSADFGAKCLSFAPRIRSTFLRLNVRCRKFFGCTTLSSRLGCGYAKRPKNYPI
jgi:hypothetical protein